MPGSHRLRYGPWELLQRSFRSSLTLDAELDQDQMPNYFECSGKAGTAYIFDSATWCAYTFACLGRHLACLADRLLSQLMRCGVNAQAHADAEYLG